MKPFVELCIFERLLEHTNVKQYKYFKILVQEFHVKIDMGLINALVAMFPEKEISESEAVSITKIKKRVFIIHLSNYLYIL